MKVVTGIAPVNIAVIKYWGKRDEKLILPINDSISATLSTDIMCAKTTIMASPNFSQNRMWLNGKETEFNERLISCLEEVKKRANKSQLLTWKIHICSENNFPTAAGLASSAAGYACVVATLATLYDIQGDITTIARQGSGSACRSLYGGFVQWHRGSLPSGEDSLATQIAPSTHWPQMRVLILVVDDKQKKYSSTNGMKQSVLTSNLLQHRADQIVPKRVENMLQAIKTKDFQTFAQITMQDSNQFHACCLDTFPPCFYMNDVSRDIVEMVHLYNDYKGAVRVAYTFDAGPNACLYLLDQDVDEIVSLVNAVFPSGKPCDYYKGLPLNIDLKRGQDLKKSINCNLNPQYKLNYLRYIIHTKVGEGSQILTDEKEHLLGENGLPKRG